MIGASPTTTDPARSFRADQWARYCGRHQTAEMIETVARAKLLERSTSNKWTHDAIPRSKTISAMSQQQNITNNNGISPTQRINHTSGEILFGEGNFFSALQNFPAEFFPFTILFEQKKLKSFQNFRS